MCEPTSIAMGAMSAAGSLAQGAAARKQARSQGEYNYQLGIWRNENYQRQVDYQQELAEWQEETYNKTAASAQESARGQYATVLEQVELTRAKTLDNIATAARAAEQGRGREMASQSETGTQGSSMRLALQQYELQEARFTHNSFKNLETSIKQSERNLLGIRSQAQNRLNAAMPAPMAPLDPVQPTQHVSQPSMLPYILGAGSGVVGAMAYQNNLEAMR